MADIDVNAHVALDGGLDEAEAGKEATLAADAAAPSIFYQVMAEAIGVCFIVVVGVNAVHGAVLAGGAADNFSVGMLFALGIMWAVYATGSVSGGHANPAITVRQSRSCSRKFYWALKFLRVLPNAQPSYWHGFSQAAVAILRPSSFPVWKVPLYWLGQVIGGVIGGTINYLLWRPVIATYEDLKNITRGTPASDITASLGFGVFPFPAAAAANEWPADLISPGQAFMVEAFGAGMLCFVVFMILDSRNTTLVSKDSAPIIIGLSIGAMISVISPLTTGCFNPARDLGPRIVGAIAGWGSRAFPGKFRQPFLNVVE
jgi:glycerol uptake facilitator protein